MSRRGVLAKVRHSLRGKALDGRGVVVEKVVNVRAQDAAFRTTLHVDVVKEKEKLIPSKRIVTKSGELRTWQF